MTSRTDSSSLEPRQVQKRWAFLVGINKYIREDNLEFCVPDVLALKALLNQAGYSVTCLHDEQPRQCEDGSDNPYFPTKENILGELERFCNRIKEGQNPEDDDLLLVYFACHGKRDEQDIPRLLANDTHPNRLSQAIAVSDVEKLMQNSRAGCQVLMLDACHIGQGDSDLKQRGTATAEMMKRIHEDAKGYALIASSTSNQTANEWTAIKHGIFAYCVLRGLSGEATDRKYVTVSDLALYLSLKIRELAHTLDIDQSPCQKVDDFAGFILIPEEHQEAVSRLCPPEPGVGATAQSVTGRGGNPQLPMVKQVIDSLWDLDYERQCQVFREQMPAITNGAVIAVQAEENVLQLWLAKRLLRKLPKPETNLYNDCCIIHARQAVGDFDVVWTELWNWLQRQPGQEGTPYDSPQAVLDALVEFYGQDQNIVIVVDDWHASTKERRAREGQAFLQRLTDEFWLPLRQRIGEKDVSPLFHRLVLCLMDVKGDEGNLGNLGDVFGEAGWIDLAPLTIPPGELRQWAPFLGHYSDNEQIRDFLEDFSSVASLKNSVRVINDICKFCGLKNGIDDIREDWRLAG